MLFIHCVLHSYEKIVDKIEACVIIVIIPWQNRGCVCILVHCLL